MHQHGPHFTTCYSNCYYYPLKVEEWQKALAAYPEREFVKYVINGVSHGFRIGFDRRKVAPVSTSRNMPSTFQHPEPVRQYLATELNANRIVEQHGEDAQIAVISRFGLIPKRGQPSQWRLIQDLSHPLGCSINDGIDKDLCSLVYVTVDMAIEQITKLGQGSRLAKIDIQHAYRIIPIHPQDRLLVGMQFEGRVFLDTTLPFGLRSAPKIFTAVADALKWVLRD